MSAEITVQADSLLSTVRWCMGFAFSAWAVALYRSWAETKAARKEALALSDRVSDIESKLAVVMESSAKVAEIRNNLRQIESAAHQFMLETGKGEALFSDLIGPDKYIREIRPVLGEKYDKQPITIENRPIAVLPSGQVIKLSN